MGSILSPGRSVFWGGIAATVLALNHFELLDDVISLAAAAGSTQSPALIYGDVLKGEARAEAQRYLPRFIAKAVYEDASWDSLGVMVELTSDSQSEQVWVENFSKVQGDLFKGLLVNNSAMQSDLTAGEEVMFRKAQISDWSFVEDGRGYGYFSVHAELPAMPDARAQIMRNFLAESPLPKGW